MLCEMKEKSNDNSPLNRIIHGHENYPPRNSVLSVSTKISHTVGSFDTPD